MGNCFYCRHSYMAGDEILCLGFMEEKDCTEFEIDDYFLEGEVTGYNTSLHEV